MFGECHAHLIMDGLNYRQAVLLHKNKVQDAPIREHLKAYQEKGITFLRDGGDSYGVTERARQLAGEYGIDYRSPIFAIHKNGYYGKIVGFGFSDMKEYHQLVRIANVKGCDFIKIMISGIMDLNCAGKLSCESLSESEIKEMTHIAHEYGLSVMAHTNGIPAASAAAHHGVDSIEHGNFMDLETMKILAENKTLYVPTAATVENLIGCGRYPDLELSRIFDTMCQSIQNAWDLHVPTVLGSDAGAYLVPHGQGVIDEYHIFQRVLGAGDALDQWLQQGEDLLKEKFRRS